MYELGEHILMLLSSVDNIKMDMNRDEPNFNTPPHNFLDMLNSLVQNNNIILRTIIKENKHPFNTNVKRKGTWLL